MPRKQVGPPAQVSPNLKENIDYLTAKLGIGVSIDVLSKELNLGGKKGVLVYIDGLTNGEVVALLLQTLAKIEREDLYPNPIQK